MADASERTPLQAGGCAPMYVFATPGRLPRSRIGRFQCCVCAALIASFVLALVVAVSFTLNYEWGALNDSIPTDAPAGTTAPADVDAGEQQLQVLLTATWPLPDEAAQGAWPAPGPSAQQVEAALAAGRAAAEARRRLEAAMPELEADAPSLRHQQATATGAAATALAEQGYAALQATRQLVRGLPSAPGRRGPLVDDACAAGDTEDEGGEGGDGGAGAPPACPSPAPPWRPLDGRCGDALRPWRGAALRPFRRALPAAYADGVDAPRAAADGAPLPSARAVSLGVHRPRYRDDAAFSVLLAVWGQFVDHDITATALSKRSADGGAVSCCGAAAALAHPECFPVPLADGDPFYAAFNLSCMEFVRSAPAPLCRLGPREQLNQATPLLDASVVYGASEEAARSLRAGEGGRLRMARAADGRELLPASTDERDGCHRAEEAARGRYCFATGDARANENLHLTTMHLLLARQHNRLAAELARRQPQWGDERLFQEARRIVAAQMQHITYAEFVPIVLGEELTERLALRPRSSGYARDYDAHADPRVANVFAAAAFRFAHTLLPGLMRMLSNGSAEYVELHKVLFNPFALWAAGGEGAALNGALQPGLLRFDPHFSPEVTQRLFAPSSAPSPSAPSPSAPSSAPAPCGLDLVSLNIQRGRDHGLPAYPAWRRHCGLSQPRSFEQLRGVVDDESLARIAALYRSVDDVDAYTGMLAEVPLPRSMLGPTLSCLLADQFVRMRRADPFWYETPQQPQAFTPAQLAELRKTSLAQLLCDTSDAVDAIQRWVLRAPGAANPRVPCASLPRPDLDAWGAAPAPSPPSSPSPSPATPPSPLPSPLPAAAHVALGGATGAGAGVRALAGPPAAAQPLDAGQPLLRPLLVGAAVRSARITEAAGRAWYGSLPLALPLPLPHVLYAEGVRWTGVLAAAAPGRLTLAGRFSAPRVLRRDASVAVEWLNGDFEFELEVLWNSSAVEELRVEGAFASPVQLSASRQYEQLRGREAHALFDAEGTWRAEAAVAAATRRAPFRLHGVRSADGAAFLWSGNVTLVLLDAVPTSPWAAGSYWAQAPAEALLALPWVPRQPAPRPPPSAAPALRATAVRGVANVSADGGDAVPLWDGALPLALPVRGARGAGALYAGGARWRGRVRRGADGAVRVEGAFSLLAPDAAAAPFQYALRRGNLSLELLPWDEDGALQDAFPEDCERAFALFVAEEAGAARERTARGDAALQLAAEGAEGEVAAVVLLGAASPDGLRFAWSGAALLPPPSASPSASPCAAGGAVEVGVEVVGGSVVASTPPAALWSGQLPMPVRPARLLARGVAWRGRLRATAPGEAQLEGSFDAGGAPLPAWLRAGSFSLQLRLLWRVDARVEALLAPGAEVWSPLWLRGARAAHGAEAWFQADDDDADAPADAPYPADAPAPAGAVRVPVALHGAFSPDGDTFWWNGRAVLAFPPPAPAPAA